MVLVFFSGYRKWNPCHYQPGSGCTNVHNPLANENLHSAFSILPIVVNILYKSVVDTCIVSLSFLGQSSPSRLEFVVRAQPATVNFIIHNLVQAVMQDILSAGTPV